MTGKVELPAESENFAPYGHTLRIAVIPNTVGPRVIVRGFCTKCGFRVQAEECSRVCEPIVQ